MHTVSDNMKPFTKRDVDGAKQARKLCAKLLCPSDKDFRWMTKNNHIKNCSVTVRNIDVERRNKNIPI